MPMFTRAEMNMHILKSGKHIDPHSKSHSVPTSMRKAKTFLEDEYLNDLSVASDQVHFFFKAKCHHSFRKNDPPHNLKVALDLVSGEVKNASCSCVAGQIGFCNHILALLMKICKLSLYGCKDVSELEEEDDMQPTKACTSTLQLWHRKGRGDAIYPQPVMEISVKKTKLDDSSQSSKEPGLNCLLYEARNNLRTQYVDEAKFKEKLLQINPAMPLAQILAPRTSDKDRIETRFGRFQPGSYGSYQLSFTEANFQVFCDINSMPRIGPSEETPICSDFPQLPIDDVGEFQSPNEIGELEKKLLEHLTVDKCKLNEIESKTIAQADSEAWKNERKFRFTASNFGQIMNRKRNHSTLVQNMLHPKPFSSRHTAHGKKYESVALMQYQKYMFSTRRKVQVLKSGFVVCQDLPILGASPDAKVIDTGCRDTYGLAEVKCPESKFRVTPVEACSDPNFFLELIDGKPRLKRNHHYYAQVQGQLGATQCKWCDFIVYTSKGMSIERIPYDHAYWASMKNKLKNYYFDHFISTAAAEFCT